MKITTNIVSRLAIYACFVFIAACTDQPQHAEPEKKITLAAYAGDTATLIYIAKWQGYFADNGLDVTINDYAAGKLATDALLAGKADISTATEFVFVSNSFNYPDLRTLGTIATAEVIELVARKDKGIKKPKDLKGKKVGVTRKSAGEFYLGVFLLFNGLSIKDIRLVDLKPNEIIEAITNGKIEAALTWDPNIYNIKKKLKDNALSWPGQGGQEFYFILISRENWIKSNTKSAERFLKALVQAEQYVKVNEATAKKFIKEKFGLESDYSDYGWTKHRFAVQLPQALLLVMESQARWRINNQLTEKTQVPNYLDYLYLDGLESINSEAITVIR
jgi:NitT/TauT family transport system substrate-binding protein